MKGDAVSSYFVPVKSSSRQGIGKILNALSSTLRGVLMDPASRQRFRVSHDIAPRSELVQTLAIENLEHRRQMAQGQIDKVEKKQNEKEYRRFPVVWISTRFANILLIKSIQARHARQCQPRRPFLPEQRSRARSFTSAFSPSFVRPVVQRQPTADVPMADV